MAEHALSNSFRTDDSYDAREADDESEPGHVVVDSEASDELLLVPDDESEPASEGNSTSELEDPQAVVVNESVCDAPVAPQPPESPIPQAGVGNGQIGAPVRLGTGSSRAASAAMHAHSAKQAQGPVAMRHVFSESRNNDIDR